MFSVELLDLFELIAKYDYNVYDYHLLIQPVILSLIKIE